MKIQFKYKIKHIIKNKELLKEKSSLFCCFSAKKKKVISKMEKEKNIINIMIH